MFITYYWALSHKTYKIAIFHAMNVKHVIDIYFVYQLH